MMKYQRPKYIGIKKSEFVAKTHFLYPYLVLCMTILKDGRPFIKNIFKKSER